ncbi:MAG: VPA1262 family N-terminal domain-containing protein [Desulfurivibrio sp.]|nr:VPA1262 family N-terminal domain-containing protein [Desulfurivibrio sp.]
MLIFGFIGSTLEALAWSRQTPVLKQIDCFMIPASSDRGERIFYRFVPRAGESLAGLKITTFDEQAHLLTDFSTQDIPADGILDIDQGDCIGAYGYVVAHQQHGVLAYSPPHPFVRQMNFSMHAGAGKQEVSVSTGESAKLPTHGISSSSTFNTCLASLIRSARPMTPASPLPLHDAKRSQTRNDVASAGSQTVTVKRPHTLIQAIWRAKHRVMIADPYLADPFRAISVCRQSRSQYQ